MANEVSTTPAPAPASPAPAPQNASAPSGVRRWLRGPLLIGIIAALIAIGLSLYGMITNPNATPLNPRSFLLVVLIAGGSWGLIAWAIAMAAVEAGKD